MVSARGGKFGFVYTSRHRAYRGIRRSGNSKTKSAKIANAGRTHAPAQCHEPESLAN